MARHRQSEGRLSGVVLGTAGDPSRALAALAVNPHMCSCPTRSRVVER